MSSRLIIRGVCWYIVPTRRVPQRSGAARYMRLRLEKAVWFFAVVACLQLGRTASAEPTPTPPSITVSLPTGNVTNSVSTNAVILLPVTTTSIDPSLNYIGFQGDFSFDETVITFSDPFVEAAGLTGNNWNITGNILPGPPGIRTLHLSGFATDGNARLNGSGTLFNLRMRRVSSQAGANTALSWATAPNNFSFIDNKLVGHTPNQNNGRISITGGTCPPPFREGFEDITTLVSGGWFLQNNSQPGPGTNGWFQGNDSVFPGLLGSWSSYIATNYNSGTGTSTLSNWLLTPPLTVENGVVLTFWTRTVNTPSFPDRLHVRLSTNGASTNVGTLATDVGDFSTLLLDINPTYASNGYPNVWTQFTVTLSGIASPTTGRLALHYFVENGGPNGSNSDYIGIETLEIAGPCLPLPTPLPGPTPTPGNFINMYPHWAPFGSEVVGSGSHSILFGISNAPFVPPGASVSLSDTTNFSITENTCGSSSSSVCSVVVRFNPVTAGPKVATLSAHGNCSSQCDAFASLTGTGRPLDATPAPTATPPVPTPTPTGTPIECTATAFEVSSPLMGTAGVPLSFQVRAVCSSGNPAPHYQGNVHFTSSDAVAELPPDSFISNGFGSFMATLHTLGNSTITVTATGQPMITGTSFPITIVAPTPSPTPTPCEFGGIPPNCWGPPTPTPSVTPTPTPSGIVLVSRLSDARAFAAIHVGSDSPPPQIQTDFLPAALSNSAMVSAESGAASATSTSNSSIVVDNQIGTLQIAGDGTASGYAILEGSYGSASAKLIVASFTLTGRSYSYSLTGQLLAEQFKGFAESNGTAKLTAGGETIFEVVATHSPAVILSQTGVLEPGDYTLSVEISAAGYGTGPHASISSGSADFDFALGPVGAPTPTPMPTATPSLTPATVLGNISTRLRVETGDNALIGGFIVTGTQPKKVIVRAIGPSLPVSGALIDPILELRDSSGGLVRANDNWRSDQEQEIISTGIPPGNDLESAIVETLPANGAAYTAIVRGANEATGVGLVEVYDLDHTVDSKLANISTRGIVQTGNDVMIAGTIVLGETSQRVLVRAIGPSLPVPGALNDPTLELRDGNGTVMRANDNWRSDQEAEIVATGIPPTNDLESALIETLPAGGAAYTAIVRGANDTTGVALVEVYGLAK